MIGFQGLCKLRKKKKFYANRCLQNEILDYIKNNIYFLV
jgi:hypothetical protein